MPGTTPIYGFPYPEPTDLVADYPALGQQLAEDIEATHNNPTFTGQATITGTVPAWLMVESDASNSQGQVYHNNGTLFLNADQNNVAANSAVRINVDGTNRFELASSGLITGSGISLGAPTAYTATISGTGWALGNATQSCTYTQIGKWVLVRVTIVFGSTSTYGAGALQISLPTGVNASNEYNIIGRAIDASTGAYYALACNVFEATNTTVAVNSFQSAIGLTESVISTKPFTWTTGDTLRFSGVYAAA